MFQFSRRTLLLGLLISILIIVIIALSVALGTQHAQEKKPSQQIWLSTSTVTAMPGPQFPWDAVRLPESVQPLHYDLTLNPDLEKGTYVGQVTILVSVESPTSHLILHSWQLNVTSVNVSREDKGFSVEIKEHFVYTKNEFYVIVLKNEMPAANYSLNLEFQGSLLGKIVGFYRSVYTDSKTNEKRYLATSKFQPTYARRAFPCFDEPSFKATFSVRLVHPINYFALSNMDVKSVHPYTNGDLMVTTFNKSPKMVTYLACFIVCDFLDRKSDNELFRVYSRPDQINNTELASQTGSVIQSEYGKYFGIPYPLPKQDLIAIPDFPSGAMEHWGLITFREARLLYDEKHSSSNDKESVVSVIAHELTHQWFGNLVTMKWWDDLWLNEGFATFFAYNGLRYANMSWDTEALIIVNDMQRSFYLDNRPSSHPIVQSVEHPDQITEIFDAISYSKGASVIRMLEAFMGKKLFQEGIRTFLKEHENGHANTQDLWEAMNKNNRDLNVGKIMDTWTKQMGFPVVNVKRHDGNQFIVNQTRYLLFDNEENQNKMSSPYNYLWEIPLSYKTKSQAQNPIVWINSERSKDFHIPQLNADEWIKFNADTTGYYRVNYEAKEWDILLKLLLNDHKALSVSDRTGVLDDAFALAEAGFVSYDVPLRMTQYLVNEESFEPWVTASARVMKIASLLSETSDYLLFRKFALNVVKPLYEKLGWQDVGSHAEKKLRRVILHMACSLEYSACLEQSSNLLKEWLNHTEIPANFLNVVFAYGVKSLGSDVWEEMWQSYLNESSAQNRLNLLRGLASSSSTWQLNTLLEYALEGNHIRSQDFYTAVGYVSSNPIGRSIAWNFFRQNWEKLVDRFTLNDRYLGNLVPTLTASFATEIQLQEMKDFFTKYENAGAGARARLQALDKVKMNIAWLKNYRKTIAMWLDKENSL